MHGACRVLFLLGFMCMGALHGMEPKDGGSGAIVVACSSVLYDPEELDACETLEHVTSLLANCERTAFNEIKEHYKIPNNVWYAKITRPIEQVKQFAQQHYNTPSFFPLRRDPLVPKELVEATERMLKSYNMDPACFDITYDQRYFTDLKCAIAYTALPGCFFIFGRPCIYGVGAISYNVEHPYLLQSQSATKRVIAHELIHTRDMHGMQTGLVRDVVVKHRGCSATDVCSQPAFQKLWNVHEIMADLLPPLECNEPSKMIEELLSSRIKQDGIVPLLTKMKAIANNKKSVLCIATKN
jgi:hypothetical protein